MKSRIRWGILGTGKVAHQFANALKLVPEANLSAVGSRTVAKAEAFAQKFGAANFYGSYADLVADDNLDIIYIATPHNYHQEHCILCLEADKSVLCEKPFTANAAEAEAVISLATAKNLFCMEAMWMRFIPIMKEVRRLIQEKYIGEICLFQGSLGYPFVVNPDSRMFNPALDANVVLDLGVYPISLAFYLFGAPLDVASYLNLGQTGIDDQGTIILRYPQHLAALSCSYRTEAGNDAVIAGTSGRIHIQQPLINPTSFSVSRFSPQISGTRTNSDRLKASLKDLPGAKFLFNSIKSLTGFGTKKIKMPFPGTGMHFQIEEVINCLQQGKIESPMMPLAETLEIMQLIDKIRHQ